MGPFRTTAALKTVSVQRCLFDLAYVRSLTNQGQWTIADHSLGLVTL
jgi:hypothetical protein